MRYFNPDLGRLIRLKTWRAHYLAWHARTRGRVQHGRLYGLPGRNWGFASRVTVHREYGKKIGAVRRRLVRTKMAALDAAKGGAQ